MWYPRQCRDGRFGAGLDRSLVRSRGQVVDHIGLTYPDLDDVIGPPLRLRAYQFLKGPYSPGETRAILIEDPNGLLRTNRSTRFVSPLDRDFSLLKIPRKSLKGRAIFQKISGPKAFWGNLLARRYTRAFGEILVRGKPKIFEVKR
ncbi:MAG: hypothetical protein CM1200mP25_0020 [Acidobacteriota bacterium]|nr:MAG: hypothetical protein CM1200mP25_0020 [Acidobacteriota bacterium]